MSSSKLWRIALVIPEAHAPAFAEAIGDHADAVSTFELEEHGDWLVEATVYGQPDEPRLNARVAVLAEAVGIPEPKLIIEELPLIDWVSHSYQGFPPIQAGRFFVHGSHHEGIVPAGSIPLLVDAATAFGTGEHGSTKGCLMALDRLARRMSLPRVGRGGALDMGCGSGILALAVTKRWRVPVTAVDIDPEAVRVTRVNAALNGVKARIRSQGGDGYHTAIVGRHKPYRLITANILARPLARMAPQLKRHLQRGGVAVLAGLLNRQERHVIQAHRTQGLHLVARIPVGEWTTLVVKRPKRKAVKG
ncbi:50S ribosomal protein L11 methyltransferase [Azospirillum sp. TSH58]|uniref:50S ribosomal protein L11 methyltransferase n=1 Tax=Azospirillum sp. TSH58 TaxID=664962 RepID=UPI000D5FE78A|nr:50S ribosomal protein L11 methyltransferase [Azospirillum sp. TSH58]AWJ84580.1 50S ribosomal protein L11 methyltransferase [Azospirillum sp. TSH58]PWC73849.1 50S ribosomal protein L11 methyltransferase [Azospirillum sp. TSH58]